jgi:arsenate reductase (thioredoxin)
MNKQKKAVKKVLFVCKGNAIRSQMAEALFNHHNKNPKYKAVSAGTQSIGKISERAVAHLKSKGYSLDGHYSKQLTEEMLKEAHVIVAMEPIPGYENDPRYRFWDVPDPGINEGMKPVENAFNIIKKKLDEFMYEMQD